MGIFCSQQFRGIFVSKPHNPHRAQCESEFLLLKNLFQNIFFLKQKNFISDGQELSFVFQGIFQWDQSGNI